MMRYDSSVQTRSSTAAMQTRCDTVLHFRRQPSLALPALDAELWLHYQDLNVFKTEGMPQKADLTSTWS